MLQVSTANFHCSTASNLATLTNLPGARVQLQSGASQQVTHATKRQRLSLVGTEDLFTVPARSLLFPALNPVFSPEDGQAFTGQSLVAAYIGTIQVPCPRQQFAAALVLLGTQMTHSCIKQLQ